ncbi:MAG: hypothetical protein M1812_004002 [Candelaria pacifica]|nr:MAG: hypothetical protein M1812_004002 [Candelaria pacifica]
MQDQKKCSLLSLPGELRNKIYEEVLKNRTRKHMDEYLKLEHGRVFKRKEHRYFRGWVDIALLYTCRTIYNEASLLPFTLNDFTIKASPRSPRKFSSARVSDDPTPPAIPRPTTLKRKLADTDDTNSDEVAPELPSKRLRIADRTPTAIRIGRNDWAVMEFNSHLSPEQRGAINHLSLTMPWTNTDKNLIKNFINSKPGWALKRLTITLDCLNSLALNGITSLVDCDIPLIDHLCSIEGFEEVELICYRQGGRSKLEHLGRLINDKRKELRLKSVEAL